MLTHLHPILAGLTVIGIIFTLLVLSLILGAITLFNTKIIKNETFGIVLLVGLIETFFIAVICYGIGILVQSL